MRKCKLLLLPLCIALLLSCIPFAGTTAEEDKPFDYGALDYGEKEDPHEFSYKDQNAMLSDMKLVATSENLELYVDETNVNIAVKNRKTGVITSANPYNVALDPTFSGQQAKQMSSQVEINYTEVATGTAGTFYSFDDCVSYGQFIIKEIDNGIEVIYSLGEDLDSQIIPDVMTEESYNWVIEQLNKDDILNDLGESIDDIKAYIGGLDEFSFPLYTYLKWDQIDEIDRGTYLESYPNLKETALYVLADSISPNDKERLQKYFSRAGYTYEMKQKDLKASGFKSKEDEEVHPNFKLTVRYTIDDNHFYSELDANKVQYNTDDFNLENVTLLRYFGASTSKADGYVFLPDGSGAILSFDDTALERPAVMGGKLYGDDNGTTYPQTPTFTGTYHLPVFGIKADSRAVFGIIEEGDGMSGIYADLGDVVGSYYCAYPIFTIKTKDSVRMNQKAGTGTSDTKFVDQFSKESFTGNFKVRYNFLNGADASYVGMADVYREYLKAKGMSANEASHSIRFQMNTLGSVEHDAKFGIIPYTATAVLTSYEDNKTMIEEFRKMGIEDFGLQLIGWQDSGLDTMAVNKYRSSSKLGGSSDLKDLIAYCKEKGIGFYPEADLMYVSSEGWFDGFSARSDAVRLINNQFGTRAALSPTYGVYMSNAYAVTPVRYADYLGDFLSGYTKKTGGTSINLARMGLYLNSDFKNNRAVDRQTAKETITKLLSETTKDNQLAFNGGNAYILPYADQMLDVPMNSNGQQGETYDVPFLQMVMMNNVSYAAPAINTASDRQDYLLRCIESQSSPAFNLIYDNADVLKSTAYTQYYNVDFNINKDDFASYYNYVKTALDGIVGVPIAEHTRLSTNVVRIRYDNGAQLYINFGKTDVTVDGHTIKAQSYFKP